MVSPSDLAPEAASRPPIVVIVGPTAAGKSELAIELAEAAGGEIVSADSQQVYRGMDIGTGKVGAAGRARIPHHLLDIAAPDEPMTAARFASLADEAIAEIAGRGACSIVVGGTGLYVRALMLGLFDAPPADEAVRARLRRDAEARGVASLWARLRAIDPEAAETIHPADLIRLTRALELYELTGELPSVHRRRHDHRRVPLRYRARFIGLAPDREELDRRIDARVDAMIAAGLVDEVRALRAAGYTPPLRSQRAIGYAELHRHLDGELTLGEALNLIKRNSRRYARRQLGWYRGDARVQWYRAASEVDLEALGRYLRPRE
jgi:tRNA dimethylallyltransferase